MNRGVLLWLATVAAVLSVLTGLTSWQRRQQINNAICILDKTFVKTIDRGLKETTLSEAVAQPVRYERSYRLSVQFEADLISHAPCSISHTTPPNLLQK